MAAHPVDSVETLIELVRGTGLFDPEWYTQRYPDVKRRSMDALHHYVTIGGKVQYAPSATFDLDGYLKRHPELKYNRVPALVHYAKNGGTDAPVAHLPATTVTETYMKHPEPDDLRREAQQFAVPSAPLGSRQSITAVIPTAGARMDLLDACLDSLADDTLVVLVVNGKKAKALKAHYETRVHHVTLLEGTFNWSVANNIGAKRATTDWLLFLNDDVVGPRKGWEQALVAVPDETRIVAPVLLNPDGTVQSAGCFRTPVGCTSGHNTLRPVRDYYAESVMGAAMLVDRQVFVAANGFDTGYKLLMAETDFCLRVGLCQVKHDVVATHHERTTRGKQEPAEDIQRFMQAHPLPQAQLKWSRFIPAKGLRVLILKLDHIGDAYMAHKAVQEHFGTGAEIHWAVNTLMDAAFRHWYDWGHVWSFAFFNENASNGHAKWSMAKWKALVARMPEFDVVIDLRLHGETKELLSAWDGTGTLTYALGKDGFAPYNIMAEKTAGVHSFQATRGLLSAVPLYVSDVSRAGKKIVFSRGSSSTVKSWPDTNWRRFVEMLLDKGYDVLELLSPGAKPLLGNVETAEVPLSNLPAWLRWTARLYVGHDSGVTHMAALEGVPVVEVMGGLVAHEGWQSVGLSVSVSLPVKCAPCYRQPCSMGSPMCIQAVRPEDVLYAVRQMDLRGVLS